MLRVILPFNPDPQLYTDMAAMPALLLSKADLVVSAYSAWEQLESQDDAALDALFEDFICRRYPIIESYIEMQRLRRRLSTAVHRTFDYMKPNLDAVLDMTGNRDRTVRYILLKWMRDEPMTGIELLQNPQIWTPCSPTQTQT